MTLNTLANYVSKQVTRKVKAIQPNQPQQPNLRFEQVGESPVLVTVAATKIAESKPEMKPEMKKEPTDSEKKMPSDSLTKSRSAGDVQEFTDMKIKFCFCPPGKFLMGSPSDEKDRSDDEDDTEGDGGSQVEVTLTKGFWLGQTEVTQQQWFDVMGTRPWRNEDGSLQQYVKEGDDIAASYISHNKAMEYCDRITERERSAGRLKGNERYSLPSEAQWEYACRAGTKTQFSFGEDESSIGDYAWFMSLEGKHPHEVGRKKPNPWKFYDLHGNCCEWCLDVYHRELEGGIDPHSSDRSEDSKFVLRGGHWGCHQRLLRSAYRSVAFPARFLSYDSGFRLCRID